MKERVDKFLIHKGYVDSRIKAQKLIDEKLVYCNEKLVEKSSLMVDDTDKIVVKDNDMFKFVSRGGFKLEKSLNSFSYSLKDKVVMDIGSSTGGFTDCALQYGAKKVIAIDVGTALLDNKLRQNPKVNLYEKTDIRNVNDQLFADIDTIVTDVSFISLKNIIDKIVSTNIKVDFIVLIKPQFECGRELAFKYKGIVLNKKVHENILKDIVLYLNINGFFVKGIDVSPIKGGDGNIEYLCYSSNKTTQNISFDIHSLVDRAFENLKNRG